MWRCISLNLLNKIRVVYRKLIAKLWVYRHRHLIEGFMKEMLTPEAKINMYYTMYILEGLKNELDVIIHIVDVTKKKEAMIEFHQRNRGNYEYLFGENVDTFLEIFNGEVHGDSSKYPE